MFAWPAMVFLIFFLLSNQSGPNLAPHRWKGGGGKLNKMQVVLLLSLSKMF